MQSAETLQYTVTAPGGGWINTHQHGASNDRALEVALAQAANRWAAGLGRHSVEVRGPGPGYCAPLAVVRLSGPERHEFEARDRELFPHRYVPEPSHE